MFDTNMLEFLDLVECEPWEVLRIPEERLFADPLECGEVDYGTYVLHFGKHQGLALQDIPKEYLRWLADQPDRKKYKSARKAKEIVRKYVKECDHGASLQQDR